METGQKILEIVFDSLFLVFFSQFFTHFFSRFISCLMERYSWYRHKFVNTKVMEKDPCFADRETLTWYKVYVRSVYRSVEKFEKTLGKLNPLHDDLKRSTTEFFAISNQEERIKRTSAIGDALTSIGSSYEECRGEFILLETRAIQISNTIKRMEKRLKERDFAFWEKKHYEEKIEKMKMDPKMLGTHRMDSNLTKLAKAQTRFAELDEQLRQDMKGLNEERFDEMENLLKMYLVQLDKYYAGINRKMNEVAVKEVVVSSSFRLTPLVQRGSESTLNMQGSITSTAPSGILSKKVTKNFSGVTNTLDEITS